MSRPTPPSFDGLRVPEPPAGLRERVLDRARAEFAHSVPRDPWSRVWSSRPLRLAWAAMVVALLVANLVVYLPAGRTPPEVSPPLAFGVAGAGFDEIAELADLPRIASDPSPLLVTEQPDSGGASRPASPSPEESPS